MTAPGRTAADDQRERTAAFVHVAHIAASSARMSAREAAALRHDLRVLRAEADRECYRPALVAALVDAVLDDLLPTLPAPAAACVEAARPATPSCALVATA
ncbi:hypothetical protein GCM10009737_03090 [Nocardioides lentus]|uniref:DUF222 domain-containing protein n=1 Tax=Nocardioides lentus TaxID=338077 RepID=A0ABP5A810_9ACTN